jgi:hypothetical protein
MENKIIIEQAKRLLDKATHSYGEKSPTKLSGLASQVCDFLQLYAGKSSAFYESVHALNPMNEFGNIIVNVLVSNLEAFIEFVENGLISGISIRRQAESDVVSDILGQAHDLLESDGIHPAAPAMIVGAALEEFLRSWVEEASLVDADNKGTLDSYSKKLRAVELISKQDLKDITSWAGIRNHAAHGHWDEVSDKKRIALMLEGVNLFMLKYGAESRTGRIEKDQKG